MGLVERHHTIISAVALSVRKRSALNTRAHGFTLPMSSTMSLSQQMPHPMKIRSIPFEVQIGHNLIKSFCLNLSVRRPPDTAGTSHT
jgi:hypothetical protein